MTEDARSAPDRQWEEMSALVDGELDPGRLAAVAGRIADDPEQARAFAVLATLKAGTAGVLARTESVSRSTRRIQFARPATVLLLGAVLGGSTAWLTGLAPSGMSPQSVSRSSPTQAVLAFRPPSMEGYGLKLDRVSFQPGPERRLEAVYRGERGCRLSLTVRRHDGANAGPSALSRPLHEQRVTWRAGEDDYQLIGVGMDPHRFAVVAEAVEAETRGGAPSPRVASLASALADRPCIG